MVTQGRMSLVINLHPLVTWLTLHFSVAFQIILCLFCPASSPFLLFSVVPHQDASALSLSFIQLSVLLILVQCPLEPVETSLGGSCSPKPPPPHKGRPVCPTLQEPSCSVICLGHSGEQRVRTEPCQGGDFLVVQCFGGPSSGTLGTPS